MRQKKDGLVEKAPVFFPLAIDNKPYDEHLGSVVQTPTYGFTTGLRDNSS
jgi:hypothetical protein